MHPEAMAYVARLATDRRMRALDVGGRDVNGNARGLFPGATWTVLDLVDGRGVDVVASICSWSPREERWDLVLCTEMLEHCTCVRRALMTMYAALRATGRLILTCAGPRRPPHSMLDGGPDLHPGEHYSGIDPQWLRHQLRLVGWSQIDVQEHGDDVYATAVRERLFVPQRPPTGAIWSS